MIFEDIVPRGFDPCATSIAVRSIGACYQMCQRPDTRAMIGIGLFNVTPKGNGYHFDSEARSLRDGELPPVLVDWMEERVPATGAIVCWDGWSRVSRRLGALADPDRHPRLVQAVAETRGRWRDLPRSITWHLKQARASSMPCLCGPPPHAPCTAELPSALLPDPEETERTLVLEAVRGWIAWANIFGDLGDDLHPAPRALRALRATTNKVRQQPG